MPWGYGPGWVTRPPRIRNWDPPMRQRPARPPLEHYTRHIRAELDMSAAVVLNSSGAGFVTLMPDGMTAWKVTHAQVATTTGPADQSQAQLYRSGVFPHRLLGQTAQGGGDTLSFEAILRPGDTLICVWQGGNAGDAATLNITGIVHALMAQ